MAPFTGRNGLIWLIQTTSPSALFTPSITPTPSAITTPIPNAFSLLSCYLSTPQASADSTKKRKRRADTIWCHYWEPNGGEQIKASDGQSLMYCTLCKTRPIHFTAISGNARKHLNSKHQIQVDVGELKGKRARQIALDISFQHAAKKRVDKDNFKSKQVLRNAINKEAFNEAQIQLITRR